MPNYSGDGLFWWATKKKCQKLNPYAIHFDDRKKSCKKKGYPIKLQYPDSNGSEYSFTVTDDKLEQMQEEGRTDSLQAMGVKVHGGGDPLYFEWASKIGARAKKTDVKNVGSTQLAQMYPYLEIDFWSNINDIATGTQSGRKHHATIKTIQEETDINLLKSVLKDAKTGLSNVSQHSSSTAKSVIESTFATVNEIAGDSIPGWKILSFTKERMDRAIRIVEASLRDIIEELEDRLDVLEVQSPFFPFLSIPLLPSGEIDLVKQQKQKDKVAITIFGGSSLLLIWALL